MSSGQAHLELRRTGYYWRRRVPSRAENRFKPGVLCFPLRTKSYCEAAAVAHRLTSISDICFNAEIDVPPELFTTVLTTYARLEIETADRLRALAGPRTAQAAEAALAMESALRASLREAIFLCQRQQAFDAIALTARHLGVQIDDTDVDYPILADKMLRLMIEISHEREKRTKGEFSEAQPYLAMALDEMSTPPARAMQTPFSFTDRGATPRTASEVSHALDRRITGPVSERVRPVTPQAAAAEITVGLAFRTRRPLTVDQTHVSRPQPLAENGSAHELARSDSTSPHGIVLAEGYALPTVLFEDARNSIRFAHVSAHAVECDETNPTLVELFDEWFAHKAKGTVQSGAMEITDRQVAAGFLKNSETILGTRVVIDQLLPNKAALACTPVDWENFTKTLMRVPKHHGRSEKTRKDGLRKEIEAADRQEEKKLAAARKKVNAARLSADQTEEVLEAARVPRLSPRTVQRHQRTLCQVLDYAVSRGLLPQNTFAGYVFSDKVVETMLVGRPDTKRKLWGDEFYALLRTELWRSHKTKINDERYWAPLIARMHGMRSEEILQLRPHDIRCDRGIHYFDIVQGTGQSVKSNNARRLIPIHSQLIELGFLTLVERQKNLKMARIFSDATRAKTKKLSFTANFSKSFRYYRQTKGVYDPQMDFHALRTTFNSRQVASATPDTARRYLMGHQNPDVGIVHYLPEGFPLETLKGFIEQEQFDLGMVTKRFAETRSERGPVLVVSNQHLAKGPENRISA